MNEIRIERVYGHPVAAVWRALTTPELHAKWFVPGDVRPIVGHAFELDMGERWGRQPCVVVEVVPERRFSYRFATTSLDTTITFDLAPAGPGTRLSFVHAGFDLDSPLARTAFEGMGKGWPGILARLDKALAEASGVFPSPSP